MNGTSPGRARRGLGALSVLWLLNLLRWHRATRPEPLPVPPAGSTTVVTDDGTRLHAQVGGLPDAAVTMVLVHGFLARTLEFDMQWNHFTDKVRLVRYDHRNHGRSQRSAKQIDVETLAGGRGPRRQPDALRRDQCRARPAPGPGRERHTPSGVGAFGPAAELASGRPWGPQST